MSKSSKSKSVADRQLDTNITQFCSVTGASTKEAKKYLEKYKRLDVAIDGYYNNPNEFGGASSKKADAERVEKLNAIFNRYIIGEEEAINIEGTEKLCGDLGVDVEDVVLLAVAYELKSPSLFKWDRQGWVDGWRALGCDSIDTMRASLTSLSQKLASDPQYFEKVYGKTFDFARSEGQRSLGLDLAQGFWALLIPHGLSGGALSHVSSTEDGDGDAAMTGPEDGWKEEYTQWWFDYLAEKGVKGVSEDMWRQFMFFVRAIDSKFENYDENGAWPSTIDGFVLWAREKLAADR